ncbi:DNA polymerase II small subunit [Thermococcus litoralis DSM 5473]|uniref:DNA polymerase II small subunit n=1 Tax=Thermococcus litoralis (strain ATCC 51850 / DSM 5473 / JCM 8560 / NS-C) TaxID=523849 RepID=H3ZPJ1_THELN|nr:DNA-directed DNA polymerase II small subunit [Thermococcus litoralis]EHR78226.1 DNA polymerase II small subunit [Thermococcus litoralis DSM 5473]
MDELVRGLMSNNYLITPPAYFLLSEHYNKDFTLPELIKFAKAKGTFIIDEIIAEEFLEAKEIITKPKHLEKFMTGKKPEEQSPEESEEGQTLEISEAEEAPTFVSEAISEVVKEAEKLEIPESQEQHLTSEVAEEPSMGEIEETSEEAVSELVEEVETLEEDKEAVEEFAGEEETEESFETNGEENGENGEVKRKVIFDEYGVPLVAEEELPEEEKKTYSVYADFKVSPREGFEFIAKDIEADFKVKFDVRNVKLKPPKAKNGTTKEGEVIVKVYENYFKSRLKKMRKILRENPEVSGVIDIGKLSYINPEGDVTIIGLVNSKRETRNGYMFEVEDLTGIIKVFIGRDKEDYKKAFEIMPDSVVAFKGRYSKRGIFFAENIYLPDVPLYKKEKPPLEEKVYAVLISDIHVGSNKFCEKAFMKFLEWLNGNVNTKTEEEIVSRIKYMIIAGDVVDGIGIYPGQYNELSIPDIFDQYEALANLLSNVPEHITMFIGPGNHDAARTALPQPEFYREYAKPLYDLKNAVIISNPAVIDLHGREFLIVHGRGIEDVVSYVPNMSHHQPVKPMVQLLKLRHLAPTFGGKVPIAPDPEDLLVIESVPDLVQMGHVHVLDYQIYRGVFLINSATWQAQTEFQKMVNIVPTPARVPIIDVETAKLRMIVDFSKWCDV